MEEDEIIVCRCEDVTLGEIRKAIRDGATTVDEIKRITRAGMGPCQGRTCRLLIMAELAKALGKSVGEVSPSTYRPPLKPVELGLLSGILSGCADQTQHVVEDKVSDKSDPGEVSRS